MKFDDDLLVQLYQHDYLVDLWHKACGTVGEAIEMYAGLKHSSCSQYVNEKGLSIDELQMLKDHARRDSVMQYASVQLEAKRRILERKVIPLGEIRGERIRQVNPNKINKKWRKCMGIEPTWEGTSPPLRI